MNLRFFLSLLMEIDLQTFYVCLVLEWMCVISYIVIKLNKSNEKRNQQVDKLIRI